jgi:hypothetical protein
MNRYDLVLALHILAAVFGFGLAAVAHSTLFRIRSATDLRQVRDHLRILKKTGPLFPVAAILLFAFGAYLIHLSSGQEKVHWGDGWIVIAIVSLVIVEAVGGLVIGRRVAALARSLESMEGSVDAATRLRLADRPVWLASHFTTAVIASVVFLMTGKPSGGTAVTIVVVGALVGLASAVPFARPVPVRA